MKPSNHAGFKASLERSHFDHTNQRVRVRSVISCAIGRQIRESELCHGTEKSTKVSQNLLAIEDFCSRLEVLPYGAKASQHYGAIRSALEKIGQPMGVNDLHIAAHARSEGLVMVTNNTAEFARVPALQVENWTAPQR